MRNEMHIEFGDATYPEFEKEVIDAQNVTFSDDMYRALMGAKDGGGELTRECAAILDRIYYIYVSELN
jgi:hypothetical protein